VRLQSTSTHRRARSRDRRISIGHLALRPVLTRRPPLRPVDDAGCGPDRPLSRLIYSVVLHARTYRFRPGAALSPAQRAVEVEVRDAAICEPWKWVWVHCIQLWAIILP